MNCYRLVVRGGYFTQALNYFHTEFSFLVCTPIAPKKPCPLKQFTLTALGIVKRFSCENDLRVDVSSEDTRSMLIVGVYLSCACTLQLLQKLVGEKKSW